MNSTRMTWFWPLSFLAALGQFLLLVTGNPGGPPVARFLLAMWALALPGIGLGNLLTKPGTRLLAQIPVQASCSLAVAYLALLGRAFNVTAGVAALLLAGLSLLVAFVFLLLPGARRSRRKVWEVQDLPRDHPLVSAVVGVAAMALLALHLGAGSPLSIRPDAPDLVAAARESGRTGELFPAFPWDERAGSPGYDAEAGLTPALIDLVARLGAMPHDAVWNLAPALVAPLVFLAFYLFGLAVFRHQGWAAAAAMLQLVLLTGAFTSPVLRAGASPGVLALIPLWTAAALFLEGLDRPHLPGVLAFGLAGLAAWGTHFTFGVLLLLFMLIVGLRSVLSLERLQEGLPLLLALWTPWVLATGLYLGIRLAAAGELQPAFAPARGLLVLGPGSWIVDPSGLPPVTLVSLTAAYLFLIVLVDGARRRAGHFAMVALAAAMPLLAYNPLLTPSLEAALGGGVHYLPLLAPLGVVFTAELQWAIAGLVRSGGAAWARMLILVATGAVTVAGVWTLAGGPAYTPGRIAASRAAPPEDRRAILAAAVDTLGPGALVLTDPVTASAARALSSLRSVYAPPRAEGRDAPRQRILAFREVARRPPDPSPPPLPDSLGFAPPFDRFEGHALNALLAAHPVNAILVMPDATAGSRPWLGAATTGFGAILPALRADSLRFEEIRLPFGASAFTVLRPSGAAASPSWLATPPGPERPPASAAHSAPPLVEAACDSTPLRAGGVLVVTTTWRKPPPHLAARLDPRGYRVRVELRRAEPAPGGPVRRVIGGLGRFRDLVAGRHRAWGVEEPLDAGRPVQWWEEDALHRQTIAVPIPPSLRPGSYSVRAAALPGPAAADGYRPGLAFLPGSGPEPRVWIAATED